MDDLTFRQAMGNFATGITVVTIDDEEDVLGMTVNAFMSISLNPKLIAISIDESASLYEQLQVVEKFGVSILKESQKDLSMIFAKQIEDDREIPYKHQDGVSVLQDSLVTITCQTKDMVKAGDHMIFIGEVTELSIDDGQPLLYFDGSYQTFE